MVDQLRAVKAEIGDAQAIHDLILALKIGGTPFPAEGPEVMLTRSDG
jgi:hypothetical protein